MTSKERYAIYKLYVEDLAQYDLAVAYIKESLSKLMRGFPTIVTMYLLLLA